MQPPLCVLLIATFYICFVRSQYLEVYPDPTDPEVLEGRRTPLYFALIQSLGGPLSLFDGSGSITGVKVALDEINNDTNLLPGYTLHYTFADSKCNRTESLKSLFKQILHEPIKMAIIGSGCSPATEPTAEISHFYNITQISCVSSSTALQNRQLYPKYFQLIPTEETNAFSCYGMIKEFGWKRVALIVQDENLFTVTVDRLKRLLFNDGIEYNEKIFKNDSISDLNSEPFDKDSRIFILFMYFQHARRLLCEAYKRNLRSPRYSLITIGWYRKFWWKIGEVDETISCGVDEMEEMLNNSLAFTYYDKLHDNVTTDSGLTSEEYSEKERTFLGQPPLNLSYYEYSHYCYDAVWTLAIALNQTIMSISDSKINEKLAKGYNVTQPFQLEDFTYENNALSDIIFEKLTNTFFNGISGPVEFGEQGIRNAEELTISQYRMVKNGSNGEYLDMVAIGKVLRNDSNNFVYLPEESELTVWRGLVPYDGIPRKEVLSVHLVVTVLCSVMATLGIIMAVICLIFNFIYWNSRLIRLTSPKLNFLIGVGAIILNVNIYFFVIPVTNKDVVSVFCNLTPWLTAIGYSLCYGTILVKMARVYYIFNNPSARKKGIQDWILILGVCLMVTLDLIGLATYTFIEGRKRNLAATLVIYSEEPLHEHGPMDIITEQCTYICDSKSRDIFLGFLYGYKMILQILALIFAFSIRKVKVKGLNDAKSIAASIYVTSIVLVVIIVSTYTLKGYINLFVSLFCIGFFAGTTVILVLVFVPLMVGLYRDPNGDNIFTKTGTSEQYHQVNIKSISKKSFNPSVENETLKKRIQELEFELKCVKENHKSNSNHIQISSASVTPASNNDVPETPVALNTPVVKVVESGTIWDNTTEEDLDQVNKGDEINRNEDIDVTSI